MKIELEICDKIIQNIEILCKLINQEPEKFIQESLEESLNAKLDEIINLF